MTVNLTEILMDKLNIDLDFGGPIRKADQVPEMDDNKFLDMLEKKYNKNDLDSLEGTDEGSIGRESFESTTAHVEGRGNASTFKQEEKMIKIER
jgi:hypothetical protein